MVKKSTGLFLSVTAFILYIAGGFGIFGGIALVLLMGGHHLPGWGEARTVGYLSLCIGVSLSIAGILFLRLVRNRTDHLISQRAKRP